jgi:hypothetical protein
MTGHCYNAVTTFILSNERSIKSLIIDSICIDLFREIVTHHVIVAFDAVGAVPCVSCPEN